MGHETCLSALVVSLLVSGTASWSTGRSQSRPRSSFRLRRGADHLAKPAGDGP